LTPDIKKFLASSVRNEWLTSKFMKVYVRKGFHIVDGQMRRCFDVASIEVQPKFQRQGVFTRWLAEVESYVVTTDLECIFVESILQRGLVPFLIRNGYSFVPYSNETCMYKLTKI